LKDSSNDIASNLKDKTRQAEMDPGVYLMKDASGKILYVGKAKNLKRRLASYFLKTGPVEIKTRTLLRRVIDFDTIVTASEKEALLLESNLIKRHRPRYNVILKDDKRYPVLRPLCIRACGSGNPQVYQQAFPIAKMQKSGIFPANSSLSASPDGCLLWSLLS
jgi:predicted GIY-YIG superfamily endonuclease